MRSVPPPNRLRLRAEALEDRVVPATITVNTLADTVGVPGSVSLRDAIRQANTSPGSDLILLPAGVIQLSRSGAGEDAALTGDLDVTDTTGVTEIWGSFNGVTTIDAGGIDRAFDVRPGANLYVQFVTVRGGAADAGGGFRNAGQLTLSARTVVADNVAALRGGGVESGGSGSRLDVHFATFENNRAGGVTAGGIGGAASVSGFVGNFNDVVFRNNTASASGGALDFRSAFGLVQRSTFVGNQAGNGGAIATIGGNQTIEDTLFDGNVAVGTRGGAVYGQSEVQILRSTFTRNRVDGTNGVGGAVSNQNFARIENSTVSGNSSAGAGGGVHNAGGMTVIHATIANNTTGGTMPGGGIFNASQSAVKIRNTIVARNPGGANGPDVYGSFASEGGNLIGIRAGTNTWVASDQLGTFTPIDPQLGPLQDNGGYTPTHALLPGSPATDRGVPNSPSIAHDQRALPRVAGTAPDVGAFEVQPGANRAPVAAADEYAVNEDAVLVVPAAGVLANDTDADGDPLAAAVAAGPAHGTLSLAADGSFTYTPAADYHGPDSFTYTVSDGNGGTATGAVTILVRSVNDAPVAAGWQFGTPEDTPLSESLRASDVDGDPLVFSLVDAPANGAVALADASTGRFTYTPNPDYNGTDSFTFRVYDGQTFSNPARVFVTVSAVNDAPTAHDKSETTDEDTLAVITPTGADVDGDPLTFAVATGPAHGAVTVNADGTFTYTPNPNYHGSDSFTYTASDGRLTSAPATVAITVNPLSDDPIAVDDAYETREDAPLTVAAPGVLDNDTDADGDALAASVADGPDHGALTLNPDGTFTYTPNRNFHGRDSFTYTVSDGAGGTATATVSITVIPVNDAPTAVDDRFVLGVDGALTVAAPGVLANDADVDGDALTAEVVLRPEQGTLVFNADGGFTYAPAAHFSGTDTFTYRTFDGASWSAPATVTITGPVIPQITVRQGSSSQINLSNSTKIAVTIFSAAGFDATRDVNINSLRFGATGTEDSLVRHKKHGTPQYDVIDADNDGRLDIVVYFDASKTGLTAGGTTVRLTGELYSGQSLMATDFVEVVRTGGKGNGKGPNK